MVESTRDYTFDSGYEIKQLQLFFGARADNIIFIDIGIDPKNADPAKRAFAQQVIGDDALLALAKDQMALSKFIAKPKASSTSRPIVPPEVLADASDTAMRAILNGQRNDLIPGHIVFFNKNQFCADDAGEKFKELFALHTLYHEAFHALSYRGPKVDDNHPHREFDADAGAAFLMLQRFGDEAVPFLQVLSWLRAHDAVTQGKLEHFTSPVIDKIIFDSRNEDFSDLSADETLRRATTYADQWTPEATAIVNARNTLNNMKKVSNPVSYLIAKSNTSPLAFNAVTKDKMAAMYMNLRNGRNRHEDKDITDAKRLLAEAGKVSYSALYNAKAAPQGTAVAETMAAVITPRTTNAPAPPRPR